MSFATPMTVLVPGAWMGAWIWEPCVAALRGRGVDAQAITLQGLTADEPPSSIAAVGLADHVRQVVEHVRAVAPRPVVLIGHSYSGTVTALAADRLGGQVVGLIHVGTFLPRDGRSLLDDWGDSDDDRAQERAAIEEAGMLWQAPTRPMLDHEPDLSPAERDALAARLTPHPGRTILDPAHLSTPVEHQPSTYVALTPTGGFDEAWRDAPAAALRAEGWRRRHLVSGHWPMVSALDATVDLLAAEVDHYSTERG